MKKYAVISMDIEDWYHTYFPDKDVDRSKSLLDGLVKLVEREVARNDQSPPHKGIGDAAQLDFEL